MNNCIFCKIINKEAPAEIVYENEQIIAFKDIKPLAPVHILIIPKIHIPTVNHFEERDRELIGELILTAQKIAKSQGVRETGYKLVFNVGKGGGQIIDHLHLHLLGGWKKEKERDIPGMP